MRKNPAKPKKPAKRTSGKVRMPKISAENFIDPAQLHERVQKKAYEIYIQRGYSHGCDLDDWLAAEQQVKTEAGC